MLTRAGSGKSTLLNSLALRLDRTVGIEGSMRLNGRDYDNKELKLMSGYVMQDDLLNGKCVSDESLRAYYNLQYNERVRLLIQLCTDSLH